MKKKKNIFSSLYNYYPNLKNSILGIGCRPNSVYLKKCIFQNIDYKYNLDFSYGMPSGHSQITWCITTYLICKIIYYIFNNKSITNSDNNNTIQNINNLIYPMSNTIYIKNGFYITFLLLISFYISYSRVYINNCHTIEQVIVGSFIGIFTGIFGFIIELLLTTPILLYL